MPRITKVYTRGGDAGDTSLGGGRRVPKDDGRIAVYGTVDELNSQIGAALASGLDPLLTSELARIQDELFHLGADLCTPEEEKERMPVPRIEPRHIVALETFMDLVGPELGPLENFILPGGSQGAALLHVARTVCRRAERDLVTLARQEPIGPQTLPYLNRLSDALFVMARYQNKRRGVAEPTWNSKG